MLTGIIHISFNCQDQSINQLQISTLSYGLLLYDFHREKNVSYKHLHTRRSPLKITSKFYCIKQQFTMLTNSGIYTEYNKKVLFLLHYIWGLSWKTWIVRTGIILRHFHSQVCQLNQFEVSSFLFLFFVLFCLI